MDGRQRAIREWVPTALGVAGVVFVTVFWAFTGRLEPTLLAAFGSMIGISEGANALRDLKRPLPPPQGEEE